MKVLLCAPLEGTVGGIQKWTNHLLKYSKENKSSYEIDVYSMSRKFHVKSGTGLIKRLVYGIREYPRIVKRYKKEISHKKYGLVHITSSASISLLKDIAMIKIARKKHVKSIIHFHFGRIPELQKSNNWEYKLLCKIIRKVDLAIVIDQKSYDSLRKAGFNNIEYLPNPVTPEIHQIINRNPNIVRDNRRILFAGHVITTKGVFELVQACKKINKISLKFIGQVSEEMKLKIYKSLGENKSWIDFSGVQDFETTIKEMMSCGVVVLPSYTEGFPNVILESMACACPIVATSVGAIPEMLGVNEAKDYGICIEPKNTEQLTVAINKMLENPGFAKECGKNAQERVNKMYNMPIVWTQVNSIWNTILN